MTIKHLPEASPGMERSKSNTAIARPGSSTLKPHVFLNALLKLRGVFFFKRKTLWNFGYYRGEDTGQAMSRGRSLANSSPTFPGRLPSSEPDSCLGRKWFLSLLLTTLLYSRTSPLGIFTINWVSETTSLYFCVNISNRIKNKTKKQKAAGWRRMNDTSAEHGLWSANLSSSPFVPRGEKGNRVPQHEGAT